MRAAVAWAAVYDQPDTDAVNAQVDKLLDSMTEKLPAVAEHLDAARPDVLAFTGFPKELWRQIWSSNPMVILSFCVSQGSDLRRPVVDSVSDGTLAGSVNLTV